MAEFVKKNTVIAEQLISYYKSKEVNENALVFLHGWKSEAGHLRSLFEDSDNFIALDLPGFGASPAPSQRWGVEDYAELLKKFLLKFNISNPILIGHSLGGGIIIKYLADGGEVQKAVLISPAGIRNNGPKIKIYALLSKVVKILLCLPGISRFREKIRKKIYYLINSEDYFEAGNMTETYKKVIRQDLQVDMKKINKKVVLIWGEKDTATPLKNGEIMNKLFSNSEIFIIKDSGHFSFIENPTDFMSVFKKQINDDK
jgi:pimeloyl-ACP methyl ester carboxylesterase